MSQRGRPFQPGNTFGKGRPPGSSNRISLRLQQMLLDNGPEIMERTIEDAKKGDPLALKICMERLIPRLKEVAELPAETYLEPTIIHIRFVDPKRRGLDEADKTNTPQFEEAA